MAEQAGAVRVLDLYIFIELAEHDINATTTLLNNFAGPPGHLHIKVWEDAVRYAWTRLEEVEAEMRRTKSRFRPPVSVQEYPRLASDMDGDTSNVASLDEQCLQTAEEQHLRDRLVQYVVAKWSRSVITENMAEAQRKWWSSQHPGTQWRDPDARRIDDSMQDDTDDS